MTNLKILQNILLIFSFLVFFNLKAQEFKWQSSVSSIQADGYYKIQLAPEIISKLNDNLSDIRLFDSADYEIPYILESEKPFENKDYFIEYKIIEKTEQNTWPYYTRLVIHNPRKNDISNIHLIIRNSDVSKKLQLNGSDDNKKWYSIKDGYRFHSMYSDDENSVIKIIDFPVSNYEYYEILIDDWKNNPLNIIKAGYYNTSIEKGKYSPVALPQISQLEVKSEKQSLVKIVFDEKSRINKITIKVEGPEFYFRKAEFQVNDSILNKRNKYEYSFKSLTSVVISSNSLNTWYFENLQCKDIYLRINNYDDAPLKIKSVDAEQLNTYMICKLEKTKKYSLKFGNHDLNAANYDLKYFKDKISGSIQTINTTDIRPSSQNAKNEDGFVLDKRFIWAAIVLVAVFLVYMISKMLNEMKSGKQG